VIVQLTPGSDAQAESRRAAAAGGSVSHVYRNVFHGFAGGFTDQALAALERNPRVTLIEPDATVTASTTQERPVWGLDRIDQRASFPMDAAYKYPELGGSGVTAYVLDTGIAPHPDLDQIGGGKTFISDGNGTTDCDGHGTHVAGTIAGNTYGVAKQATLVPVRVLDCSGSGSWSGVIAGLDYVISDHDNGERAVANLSLGGPANRSVDTAVSKAVRDGVTVAVAAGNSNANACQTSPARVPEALTVGATDNTDRRASWSNYGSCLDLFAPGVGITSSWHQPIGQPDGSVQPLNTISGTSMASPHVAGAAALVLGNGYLPPADVASRLIAGSTPGVVSSAGTRSPNRLLYVDH
jgi:subtilisin family serine protease